MEKGFRGNSSEESGTALEHFHFYSEQDGAAKCGFS
jgi:hypothetical protein